MCARSSSLNAQPYTEQEVRELLELKLLMPEDNDNLFKNMIGNKEVVKYFTNLVKLFKSNRSLEFFGKAFHPSFLLLGVEGTGKALTAYTFANEMELPIFVIESEKLLQDYSTRMIKGIKQILSQYDRSVVLFKDVNYGGHLDTDKSAVFFSNLCNIKNSFPESFFFATASITASYPSFFYGPDGFDNSLSFNLPDPKERVALIKKFLVGIPHDPKLDFDKVCRDFIGFSGGAIADMLKKAYIQALIEGKDKLTYEVINATIYSETFGSEVRKMSEKEVRLTAYHEAGHVIAGYYGCPNYKVSKVEVVFRSSSLGLTDPESDEDKLSMTREDCKGYIIGCFGGKCAEQIIFNTNTSGVVSDLAQATLMAESYIKLFGMDDTFGPICLSEDVFMSDVLAEIADIKIQELLIGLEKETTKILNDHKDKLIALAEALIKKETLYKEEVTAILEGKPLLTPRRRGQKKEVKVIEKPKED